MWCAILYVCVILILPCQTDARLCDRMTSCDLIRFIRTHNKQISTVDEKTVRIDFLTASLYKQGSDIRTKVTSLENNLEGITFKWNSHVEMDDEFERVDHRGANEHLRQLMMVLRKWLVEVRTTLNNTFHEALFQNEEIQRLREVTQEGHQKVRALKNSLQSRQIELPLRVHKEHVTSNEDTVCFNGNGTIVRSKEGHTCETDTGIGFASLELQNIKTSLASLVRLVNETENYCLHRISKVATKINGLQERLNALGKI